MTSARVTLEPRLLYLYVPYRNQDQLPMFDTGLPDLDPVELFRNNRYVGADRVGDANQVSIGVTSRLLDSRDGRQFLTATVGQIYYFTNPRVLLPDQYIDGVPTPTETPRTDNRSDFVAQVALTAFQNWSADIGIQWNPQTSQTERSEVNVQYKTGRPVGRQRRLPLPAGRPRAGRSCPAPGRSAMPGTSSSAASIPFRITSRWSALPGSSTVRAAGGCGSGAAASSAPGPAPRIPVCTCNWNSPAWQVSDPNRILS